MCGCCSLLLYYRLSNRCVLSDADSGGAEVVGYEIAARHLLHSHREPGDPLGSETYGEWYILGQFTAAAPAQVGLLANRGLHLQAHTPIPQAGRCADCGEVLIGNLLLGRTYQFKVIRERNALNAC